MSKTFLMHIPDLMVPIMTEMQFTVECYGFWENCFKIIEVAFSQQNFYSALSDWRKGGGKLQSLANKK